MRLSSLCAIAALGIAACHRTTDMSGIYVNAEGEGTLFPCTDANAAVLVPDSTLAARYFAAVNPSQAAYVDLRGFNTRSGSIYSGRRSFVVEQILAVRARADGDCPAVAHSVTSVLRE